jgi:hypothetical protein
VKRISLPCAAAALLLAATVRATEPAIAAQLPPGARVTWLDNGILKLGADLAHGGAIVFLSRGGGPNLVNNYDFGRQIQLSFYSGPVPFSTAGQQPAKHWEHLGWNPVQTGDDFRNAPEIVSHQNDGRTLHVQCRPLQWPLNNIPAECLFDSWLELDGHTLKGRARLSNRRGDTTQYPARMQELPAVYATGSHHRVVSYMGNRPFRGEPATAAPQPAGSHPWSFWHGTEGWSALLDETDHGIGLITPGRQHFTGGFAGTPGPAASMANSTGYLAGLAQEILDHNIRYEFRYEIVAGSLTEIRSRAAQHKPPGLPAWRFAGDRQGWHFVNAGDHGWPVPDGLRLRLPHPEPQLISPLCFWMADDAPFLHVEILCPAPGRLTVYWQQHGSPGPTAETSVSQTISGSPDWQSLAIPLRKPEYRGPMVRLRLDPRFPGPSPSFQIRSVRLAASPD